MNQKEEFYVHTLNYYDKGVKKLDCDKSMTRVVKCLINFIFLTPLLIMFSAATYLRL